MQDNQKQALPRELRIPYGSGLIDGDGSICAQKRSPPNKTWDVDGRTMKISYLCGLYDTEGSIIIKKCDLPNVLESFKRVSPIYSGLIRIGMVQKEPLELLNQIWPGGHLRCEGVRKDRPTYQIMYRWELSKKQLIINCLKEMLPFLIAKKEQACTLLDFLQNWKDPYNRKLGIDPEELLRREESYQRMRKLNAVGAAATTKPNDIREDEAIV